MGVKCQTFSEYQRAFKSEYPCFATTYETNVEFRANRRSVEHNHNDEPFQWWDTESETDSDLTACVGRASKRPTHVPKHVHKHEKFNKTYHDRLKQLTQDLSKNLEIGAQNGTAQPIAVQNEGSQTDAVVTVDRAVNGTVEVIEREQPLKRTDDQHHIDQPLNADVKAQLVVKQKSAQATRPKHPAIKKSLGTKPQPSRTVHVPKPRPSSAPVEKEVEGEKPPFVPYGFQDREFVTGTQRTYNVRASADVHESALTALKRRRAEIARRQKSAPLKEKKKRPLFNEFNERVRRETSQWDTEYRSHFAGYDRSVYERSLSARPVSREHAEDFFSATW